MEFLKQTLANAFDNSNKNPKVISSKGLQQNLQQARKSEEKKTPCNFAYK